MPAANLIKRVLLPESGLRQWVLTFPFSWRRRLAQDGALPERPAPDLQDEGEADGEGDPEGNLAASAVFG